MNESMAFGAKDAQIPRCRAKMLYWERIDVMDVKVIS
jgi:hypothetical protein